MDGDVKFRCRIDAVQVLFLKVHIHFDFPQHPGDFDAVKGVSRKPADGFHNNHVHLAAPALANQLVELIALFHTGAGDALVGINPRQFPSSFPTDTFCIVVHLIFIAVKLFILLGGYSAVCRYPFDCIL